MPAFHDAELEDFKRTIDLVEYAKKTGYEVRPLHGLKDVIFLEHPDGDRIGVARRPDGAWIYTSVIAYGPLGEAESPEGATRRLRQCIERVGDKGSIVEFVQARDWTARRGEVPLERVRERLRSYLDGGLPLDFEGPLHPPRVDDRKSELNQRRYDWTASPAAPPETEVEQRLRRWNAAQRTLDEHRGDRGENRSFAKPGPATEPALGTSREARDKSEPERRRYDWAPPVEGAAGIARRSRDRGPERGR